MEVVSVIFGFLKIYDALKLQHASFCSDKIDKLSLILYN